MPINKKLVHFKTFGNFKKALDAGEILDTSIVFIKETQEIYTHGLLYSYRDLKEFVDDLIYLMNEYNIVLNDDADLNEYTWSVDESALISTTGRVLVSYANGELVSDAINYRLPKIPAATLASGGVMSPTDKTKLDSIEDGANKYVLPTASVETLGGIKTNLDRFADDLYPVKTNDRGYAVVPISKASDKLDGIMSKDDKKFIDGFATSMQEGVTPIILTEEGLTGGYNWNADEKAMTYKNLKVQGLWYDGESWVIDKESIISLPNIPVATTTSGGIITPDEKKELSQIPYIIDLGTKDPANVDTWKYLDTNIYTELTKSDFSRPIYVRYLDSTLKYDICPARIMASINNNLYLYILKGYSIVIVTILLYIHGDSITVGPVTISTLNNKLKLYVNTSDITGNTSSASYTGIPSLKINSNDKSIRLVGEGVQITGKSDSDGGYINIAVPTVSTNTDGIMSKNDKTKLDSIDILTLPYIIDLEGKDPTLNTTWTSLSSTIYKHLYNKNNKQPVFIRNFAGGTDNLIAPVTFNTGSNLKLYLIFSTALGYEYRVDIILNTDYVATSATINSIGNILPNTTLWNNLQANVKTYFNTSQLSNLGITISLTKAEIVDKSLNLYKVYIKLNTPYYPGHGYEIYINNANNNKKHTVFSALTPNSNDIPVAELLIYNKFHSEMYKYEIEFLDS